MSPTPDQMQRTYERLKSEIDRTYPTGHLVALHESGIIADAGDFDGILKALKALERDPQETLVACAGSDDLEPATILLHG